MKPKLYRHCIIITFYYLFLTSFIQVLSQDIFNNNYSPSVSSSKKTNLQVFKSIGVKISRSLNQYGWQHPFPLITKNFKHPGMYTASFGGYIEGLSTKYFSTVIELAYRGRSVYFDYNLYDGNGNVISTNETSYGYNITSFGISEKLKYSIKAGTHELDFYCFAGLRYEQVNAKNLDEKLYFYMSTHRKSNSGYITGLGFSVGKKFRFSTEVYYLQDFYDFFSTEDGKYKNHEVGLSIGFGLLLNNF
jgi:hypothetical protein